MIKPLIIVFLTLIQLTPYSEAFPIGQLHLVSGPSSCDGKIEIQQTQGGFVLANEFREIIDFSFLNQGTQCRKVEPAGRIFRRMICEKSQYFEASIETLSHGQCDSDLGFRCNPKDHMVTLESVKANMVQLTQEDRYPELSSVVCVYKI